MVAKPTHSNAAVAALGADPMPWTAEMDDRRIGLCEYFVAQSDAMSRNSAGHGERCGAELAKALLEAEQALTILGAIAAERDQLLALLSPINPDAKLVTALVSTHQAYLTMRGVMDGSDVVSLMVSEREFRDACAVLFRDHSMDLLIRLALIAIPSAR